MNKKTPCVKKHQTLGAYYSENTHPKMFWKQNYNISLPYEKWPCTNKEKRRPHGH